MMNPRALTSNYQTIWKEKDENERKKLLKEKKIFPRAEGYNLDIKRHSSGWVTDLLFFSMYLFPLLSCPLPNPNS